MYRENQICFYHFSIPEATKLISTLVFGRFCLIKKVFFLQYVLVYTQPTQIGRERDTKQIKILVLVLLELGFWCFRKAQIYFKREIVQDQKVIQLTLFIVHTNYIVYFWLSVTTTKQPALESLKIPILQEVKKSCREKILEAPKT